MGRRNPENPANPVNLDSDGDAQPPPMMRWGAEAGSRIARKAALARAAPNLAFSLYGLAGAGFDFRRSDEGRNMEGDRVSLSESGFSGFRFAQLALFAITGDSDKTIFG